MTRCVLVRIDDDDTVGEAFGPFDPDEAHTIQALTALDDTLLLREIIVPEIEACQECGEDIVLTTPSYRNNQHKRSCKFHPTNSKDR